MPKLPARLSTCPNCQQRSLSLKHRIKAYFGGTICTTCSGKLKLSRAPAIVLSVIFAFVQLPVGFTLWLLLSAVLSPNIAAIATLGICVAVIEDAVLLTARFKPA